MNITELKSYFKSQIKEGLYPVTEIDSFFQILIKYKLGLNRIDIALNPKQLLDKETLDFFNQSIQHINKQTPIQYIIGETEFYSLPFKVNKHVLIPRPETEELVDWIVKDNSNNSNLTILDIGTGSGCIPISIAKNLTNATVNSYDISSEALKIAKKNALLNNVAVNFKEIDILNTDKLEQQFDIIVSNPPYVREQEKKQIKNNVLQYEPHIALFVENNNALVFYDKIADLALSSLHNNGKLYFEINQYLGKETVALLKSKGFKNILLRKDIYGNDRMIRAEFISD